MNPMEENHTKEMRNKLYLDNFYVKMDGKYIKKPVNEELEKMLTNVDMEQRINMPFTTEIGYTVEEGDAISAEEIAEERICKRLEKYNAEDTFIEFDNDDDNDGEFDLLSIEMPKICSSDIEFSESEFDVSAVARGISLEIKSKVSEEGYSRNSGFNDILNSNNNDNDENVNSIVIKNNGHSKHKTISSTPKKRDNQDTPSKSSDICENNEIKSSQLLDELTINENEGKSLDNINLDDFNSIYKSFFTSRGEKPTLNSNGRFV